MTSPVDICNLALDQARARASIQGINPPTPPDSLPAQVASRNYQIQVDAVLRAAHWNCARMQGTLNLLKAASGTPQNPENNLPAPPTPWLYEYALPVDCLKIRFVIPMWRQAGIPVMTNMAGHIPRGIEAAVPFVPALDTDANGNRIKVLLTNAPNAQVVYTARIDPDFWDASLTNAIIATLAAWFVNPLTGNKELLAERVQVASGLVAAARLSDGNEGITTTDNIPDWLRVREHGGYGWGREGEGGGTYLAAWDALSLPTGQAF